MTFRPPLITKIWGAPSSISLKTWSQNSQTQLIGKDTLGSTGRGSSKDQPNPTLAKNPSVSIKTWSQNTAFQLIGKDAMTSGRGTSRDQPNPRGALQGVANLTAVSVLATALLTGTLAPTKPPIGQYDWPNPQLPWRTKPQTAARVINTTSQDRIYGGSGLVPTYDWQNPKLRTPASVETLGGSWGTNFRQLFGKDTFTAGGNNFDWPNPRSPQRSIALLTAVSPSQTALKPNSNYDWPNPRISISWRAPNHHRTFKGPPPPPPPVAPQNYLNFDWPNPRGPQRSIDLLTWALPPSRPIAALSATSGFSQKDWPNPRGYTRNPYYSDYVSFLPAQNPATYLNFDWPNPGIPRRSVDLLSSIGESTFNVSQVITPVPHTSNEQVLPRWPVSGVTLRTWAPNAPFQLLGKDTFTAGGNDFDWPNPQIPARQKLEISARVLNDANQDVIYGSPGQVPTYDWQNPTRRTPAVVDVLGGSQGTNFSTLPVVNLFPPGIGNALTFDWPNPKGYVPVISLKTWTDNHVIYRGQDKFFGAGGPTYDWQNPRGYQRSVELLSWTKSAQVVTNPRIDQKDWPNPRGYVQPINLRTWTNSSNLETLTQSGNLPQQNLYQWPNPTIRLRASIDALSWIEPLNIAIQPIPATRAFDWPNPGRSVHSIVLKTWIDQTKINLQDKFFGLGGPSYDWPNPRGPVSLVNRTGISFVLPLPIPPHKKPKDETAQFGGGTGLIFPDAEESIGMLQPTAAEIFGDEEVGYDERLVVLLRQLLQLENDNRERQTREYEDDRANLHRLIRNAYLGIVERDKVPPPGWTAGGPWEPPFHPMDDRRIAAHLKFLTDFLDKIRNDARLAAIEEDDADVWILMG